MGWSGNLSDLNIIYCGLPGPELSALADLIQPGSESTGAVVSEWPALPDQIVDSSPDLVVIIFEQFLGNNPQIAVEAHEFLHENRVPSLVVLGDDATSQRRIAEMIAGFEVILEPPYDESRVADAMAEALDQHPSSEISLAESGDYAAVTIAQAGATALSAELHHRELWPDEEELWLTPVPGQEIDDDSELGDEEDDEDEEELAAVGPPPPVSEKELGSMSSHTDRFGHPAVIAVPLDTVDEAEGESGPVEELDLSDWSQSAGLTDTDFTHPDPETTQPEPESIDLEPAQPEPVEERFSVETEEAGNGDEELEVRDWTDTVYDAPITDHGFDSAISSDPRVETMPSTPPVEPEEPIQAASIVTVELPDLSLGNLVDTPALQVFFGHWVLGHTGRLVLRMGRINREVAFSEGTPGLVDAPIIDPATRNRVLASLVWSDGTYSFHEGSFATDRFCAFGDPLELIHSAIHQGLSLNQVIAPLTPMLKRFPILTTRVHMFQRNISRLGRAESFLERCGDQNLENIAGSMSEGMEETLKDALFCYYGGLIFFSEGPIQGPVELRLETVKRFSPASEGASGPRREAGNLDEDAILADLSRQIRQYQGMTPYGIFSLEPGDGRNRVKETYYKLVKDHHPDTYALARSPDIQPMAEMAFRMIRDAYGSLMRSEKSDTEAPRSTVTDQGTSGSPSFVDGSASGPHTGVRYAIGRGGRESIETTAIGMDSTPKAENAEDAARKPEKPKPRDRRISKDKARKTNPPRRRRKSRGKSHDVTADGPSTTQRRRFNRSNSGRIMARVKSDVGTEMDPKQLFKTGNTLLGSGSNERAMKAFEKALEKDPENTTYLAHYAWAMYLVDTEKAAKVTKLLKEAAKKGEGGSVEWPTLFLGHLMTAEGRADQGVEYYERCLQANPNNIEAKRRLRLHDMRKSAGGGFLDKLFKPKKKKKK